MVPGGMSGVWERADQGAAQDLQGLVDGAAPGLDRETGPGQDQAADRAGLLLR